MAQCKKSDCREQALPFGKRYCARHKAEYERKQAEYERVRSTLRKCEGCGQPLTLTRHNNGEDYCSGCAARYDKERAERLVRVASHERANEKRELLASAANFDDLKNWMIRYLL